jgi:hypothetical protein
MEACSKLVCGFIRDRELPLLLKVAKMIHASPASSSIIERLFSQTADCLTKKRNQLKDDTLLRLNQTPLWSEFKKACDRIIELEEK